MKNSEARKNFRVSARALLHLGAELITSDEIALYELIKNSFDAEAAKVWIRVVVPVPVEDINQAVGLLPANPTIKDKQHLVDYLSQCARVELSDDVRAHLQERLDALLSAAGRDNLLDIAGSINYIEIEDDGLGIKSNDIENVFLMIGTDVKAVTEKGGGQAYLGNKGIGRLSMMRLGGRAEVTSWTEVDDRAWKVKFDWDDFDDGTKLIDEVDFPLHTLQKPGSRSGVKISITKLKSDWTIDDLRTGIVDRFLRRLQNPFVTNLKRFPIHISYNGGKRVPVPPIKKELIEAADRQLVLKFDSEAADGQPALVTTISRPGAKGSEEVFHCDVATITRKLEVPEKVVTGIGPFTLTIKWFNRANLAKKGLGSDLGDYKRELNNWSGGIAIYRDGFRVGLTGSDSDGDWLGLDSRALRGQGFTVNRIQVVGALEIGSDSNPRLRDRSNREGLIESKYSKALREILIEFGANLLKSQIQAESEKDKAEQLSELVDEGAGRIEERLNLARKNINSIKSKVSPEIKKHVVDLESNLQFVSNRVVQFSRAITELKENREDILELAGVGTVMHSILHELARTTTQTRSLLSQVSETADGSTKLLLDKLESEIKAINVRLRQLDPLSTSGRQRKKRFDLVRLTNTIVEGYRSRFERHGIDIEFMVDELPPTGEVLVNMVAGFYSLALENLLTNSIYWIKSGPLLPGAGRGHIRVDIDSKSKVLHFDDNGPGISHTDKERVFNPGFSLKKKGSGYGLYIAREVAEHHDSKLYLGPSESPDGRLRTFVFELPKE